MIFVFRNNTVEPFFGEEYFFSGYGDVSDVVSADSYLWWYQIPLNLNYHQLIIEINSYTDRLKYILNRVDKTFYIFTLTNNSLGQIIESGNQELNIAIDDFNRTVREAGNLSNVKVIETQEFLQKFPQKDIVDWKYYFTAQYPYSPKLIKPFKEWWNNKLRQISLSRKKCLILDLDNTLWGGILGEDGVFNIKLSGDYPGKAFHHWQVGIKELKQKGVILAICSKNNTTDVEELWNKRTDMVLQKSDFAIIKTNWNDKATNIQEITTELNIGLDSVVFIDDNPAERELVRKILPMVVTPDFPSQPYELPMLYQMIVSEFFSIYKITKEDTNKTEQYIANAKRNSAMLSFTNFDDYLSSLEMHLTICPISDVSLSRVAQMTQKTNQFNLTTHRYTEADLLQMLDDGAKIWTLAVEDKFGDSGVSGAIIFLNDCSIDTFLLSCRILGRGIETAFLNFILKEISDEGVATVTSSYIPTAKNGQVCDFWDKEGFDCIKYCTDGEKNYILNLCDKHFNIKPIFKIN